MATALTQSPARVSVTVPGGGRIDGGRVDIAAYPPVVEWKDLAR